MTAICARAKLTERYFYESFSSRDELLKTILDGIADEVRDAGLTALRASDGTLEQRVRDAIASFVTLLTDDPRKGRVAMIESAAYEPLRAHRRAVLHGFAQMVADEASRMYGDRALAISSRSDQRTALRRGPCRIGHRVAERGDRYYP